ncbi:MAG: alpha/beta hydrolase [Pseudomonadota bacterium]
MAFDDLPRQSPINPRADRYAAKALSLSRAVAESSRCVLDIAYGADPLQKLDLYLPESADVLYPVVVFLHGGGWTHGFKEWMGFMAPPIVAWPAAFVSVGYRLAPDHRYPAQLEDTLLAIAWVQRNIGDYGGDPNAIVVGGHSAGGHLASLAALRTDLHGGYGIPSEAIRACLPVSSTFDFRFDTVAPGSGEESILTRFLATPDQALEASPIAYAVTSTVPFLISHGSDDLERVSRTAPPMVAALRQSGTLVDYLVLNGCDHFSVSLGAAQPDDPWVLRAAGWVRRFTGPPSPPDRR